jgi:hypothetical protein
VEKLLVQTQGIQSVWGHHLPLRNKINTTISVYWTINLNRAAAFAEWRQLLSV